MRFIDTHTHNYDEAYVNDVDMVIERAIAAGVTKLIQPDIDSAEREALFKVVDKHKDCLFPMLGLYPGSVTKDWMKEIEKMLPYKDRGIVAIGEIGLDYHFSTEFAEEQKEAFKYQLNLAAEWDLPVNIHLRDATEAFFEVLEDCKGLPLRGNMHAFSGSIETYERLQKYGDWYVGIGGVVTFKKASIAKTVKDIPLDRILLETDSPYLTPTPHRGTRNESAYIPLIAAKIAEIKDISIEKVAEQTTANAEKLFKI